MSSAAIITIAVAAVVVLAAIAFLTAARRSDVRGAGALSKETRKRDRDSDVDLPAPVTRADAEHAGQVARAGTGLVPVASSSPPVAWTAPDPEMIGVSRRQFLNRATVTLMSAGLGAFAAAGFVAFLWPIAQAGFGGKVNVGKLTDVMTGIAGGQGFFYNATAKSWITPYPSEALPKAKAVPFYAPIMSTIQNGIIVMYQKCPHLGCRVPSCPSSQWFECPCHGSQYNHVGEKKGGPAPRGMDHFSAVVTAGGDVVIDTGVVYTGVPIGTNTTGQEAEGPHCIGGGHE
ncbi:MAG: putative iron-sulfur protein [Ilumatobacteraceae bacterium]|jgi:cytochrome b6-f complex iron-sulfur subunit|nr:putative iron-sulfur protein [Ilumatobacteraceae bacterium]